MVFVQLQKESQVRITAELAKKPQQQKRKQTNKKKSPKNNTQKKPNHKKLVTFIHFKTIARKSGC